MHKRLNLSYCAILVMTIAVISCKRDIVYNSLSTGNFTDTSGALKDAAAFPIGLAIDYTLWKTDASYAATVKREAASVTFGYQMKHGAIVKDDGSFDYSKS